MDFKQHDYTPISDDDLSEFYIQNGPRKLKGGLCITDPKYRMPAPPPLERWERVGLDDVAYIIE